MIFKWILLITYFFFLNGIDKNVGKLMFVFFAFIFAYTYEKFVKCSDFFDRCRNGIFLMLNFVAGFFFVWGSKMREKNGFVKIVIRWSFHLDSIFYSSFIRRKQFLVIFFFCTYLFHVQNAVVSPMICVKFMNVNNY